MREQELYNLLNELEEGDYNVEELINNWLKKRDMFVADANYYLFEVINKFKELSLDNYVKRCKKIVENKKSTLTDDKVIEMDREVNRIQLEQINDILSSLYEYDLKLVKQILKEYNELKESE